MGYLLWYLGTPKLIAPTALDQTAALHGKQRFDRALLLFAQGSRKSRELPAPSPLERRQLRPDYFFLFARIFSFAV